MISSLRLKNLLFCFHAEEGRYGRFRTHNGTSQATGAKRRFFLNNICRSITIFVKIGIHTKNISRAKGDTIRASFAFFGIDDYIGQFG
jgi:hypothetical protein